MGTRGGGSGGLGGGGGTASNVAQYAVLHVVGDAGSLYTNVVVKPASYEHEHTSIAT